MKHLRLWRPADAVCCAVLLALAAAGCQAVRAPEDAAQPWTPDAGAPSAEPGAWRAAGKAPAHGADLRLPDLVDLALAQSPSLGRAWQAARAAEAQFRQSNSYYYPQLTAGGKASWQRTDANAAMTEIDTTSYGPSAQLNWLLLDCGGPEPGGRRRPCGNCRRRISISTRPTRNWC